MFLFFQNTCPVSYSEVPRDLFPEVELTGCEISHSAPSSGGVKNVWFYTSIPLYAFI